MGFRICKDGNFKENGHYSEHNVLVDLWKPTWERSSVHLENCYIIGIRHDKVYAPLDIPTMNASNMKCKELPVKSTRSNVGKQSVNGKAIRSHIYSNLGLDENNQGVTAGPPQILAILSAVLERIIQSNDKLLKASREKDAVTVFHGSRAPALSIRQYIERMAKYSSCSPSCFVVSYIYLERYLQQMDVYLTSLNVHRLLITSVLLAAKYIDDECYNNAYFAKVGGISTAEMNTLEIEFLATIDFKLHVPVETFDSYCLQLNLQESAANLHPNS